jgi:hypothetical protein
MAPDGVLLLPVAARLSFPTVFSCEPPDIWDGDCDPRFSSEHTMSSDHLIVPTSASTSTIAALAAASAASSSVAANAASECVGGYFDDGLTLVEINSVILSDLLPRNLPNNTQVAMELHSVTE